MDVSRLFADKPPLRPLTDLAAVVEDWRYRFVDGEMANKRDQVVEFCAEAKGWGQAVHRACMSRDAQGKMHNHQSRVPHSVKELFSFEIRACYGPQKAAKIANGGFDSLFDALELCVVPGIGPVTHYDVAVRCGAYLGVAPDSLYLHAGVWEGWKTLMTSLYPADRSTGRPRYVIRDYWPKELQALPADEVEDLLCTYREIFKEW